MADLIKKIKIKKQDGTFTDYIPIGAEAKNVDMNNGKDLQETIGTIDIDKDGSIAEQLGRCKNYDNDITILNTDINNLKAVDIGLENDIIDLQIDKINRTDIIDNLNSSSNTKVLSANQGKVLEDKVTTLKNEKVSLDDRVQYIFPKMWPNAFSGDIEIVKYKNKNILIDTHHSNFIDNVLDFLSDNNFTHADVFICSHYHLDHYSNFEALCENGIIDNNTQLFLMAETTKFNWETNIAKVKNICNKYNLNYYTPVEEGEEYIISNTFKMRFWNCDVGKMDTYYPSLSSDDHSNSTSLCVVFEHGKNKVFMGGDSTGETYSYLLTQTNFMKEYGNFDLFKIGHHGINDWTNYVFLMNIAPTFSVQPGGITDFAINNFGISAEISTLSNVGSKIYPIYMQNNNVIFESDESKLNCISGKNFILRNYKRDRHLYVDINASKNEIQDGTKNHPFSEIMQAIMYAEKENPLNLFIHVADGTYCVSHSGQNLSEGSKNVLKITDSKMNIIIQGNNKDKTKVIINGIEINRGELTLRDLTIDIDNRTGLKSTRSRVYMNNCNIKSITDTLQTKHNAIETNNSTIYLLNCLIENANKGISGTGNTIITSILTFGTLNTTDYFPEEQTNISTNYRTYFKNGSDKVKLLTHTGTFEKAITLYKDEARDGNYGLSPIILPISIKNFSHYEVEYAYYLNRLHLKLTTGKLHSLHVFSGTQLRATEYTSTQKIEAIATLSVDADGNFSVWGTNIDKIDKNTGTHTFDTTPCFKITRITAYKSDLDVDYSS